MRKIKMSFATELALTFTFLLFIIMLFVGVAVHVVVTEQFTSFYKRHINEIAHHMQQILSEEHDALNSQIQQLSSSIFNKYHLNTPVFDHIQPPYIIEDASESVEMTPLEALEILDQTVFS